jgi:hypothetical protein
MTFAGAAKHVKVLEGAGLIARRKVGRMQLCSLQAGPLAEAERWLRQWRAFWTSAPRPARRADQGRGKEMRITLSSFTVDDQAKALAGWPCKERNERWSTYKG